MSRSVTLNYVRFLSTPTTSFDPVAGTGVISAQYSVGTVTGTAPNQVFTDHPTCTNSGSASVPLGPTDTAGAKLQTLVGLMLQQEGLTAGTDHAFDSSGKQLA